MKSVIEFVDRLFADSERETNARGNTVRRGFMPSSRYKIDFATEFFAEGWEQFDTDQDAEYFGFWVKKGKLQTLTYCEGDWIAVDCPDAAHYNAEINNAIEYYGEGFIAKAIDGNGSVTTYRQAREGFLIAV